MTADPLAYYEIPEADRRGSREGADILTEIGAGDRIEMAVLHDDGTRDSVALSEAAAAIVRDVLAKLADGQRVTLLQEDAELSPEQAAKILGISRPLVVQRMTAGRLPFRYVGAHRRCRLGDVLRLKADEAARRRALDDLAADTEDLMAAHGL
jgi:excisionase family DNA binding protein